MKARNFLIETSAASPTFPPSLAATFHLFIYKFLAFLFGLGRVDAMQLGTTMRFSPVTSDKNVISFEGGATPIGNGIRKVSRRLFTTVFITPFTKIDKEQKKRFRKEALNGSGKKFYDLFYHFGNNFQLYLVR